MALQPRRDIEFLPHDAPLREDVRRLGALVGEMLAEQLGAEFLARVESIRTAAIRSRDSVATPEALTTQVAGLDPKFAAQLTRAFATYFQVVNIAERVHRIRRRRAYERAGASPQPDSLRDALEKLKRDGVTLDELVVWLPRFDVEPVFTAHPTEAVRRTLLEKEQTIFRCLVANLDGTRTPHEQAADEAVLRMALTAGWQTAESSRTRPRVQDEFEHVGFYLSDPIYRVVPVFYEVFSEALHMVYGQEPALPTLMRFGSWVGGDMDGNPNVNAETIAATLRTQRALVLDRYDSEVAELARELSQSVGQVQIDAAVLARIDHYRKQLVSVSSGF